ncbi:MAG: hypothetical protein JWO02_3917 [Solirubrobacterales bacterium]|nr:hypothetical protein [Solirubrobacterales bacterium]
MPSVSKSVDLSAPPDAAFALVTDTSRYGEWLTIHADWPDGAPASTEAGSTFTQKITIMGMPADVNWTVESYDAPSSMVLSGGGPLGAKLATTINVAPSGGGSTVSYEVEFSGGGIEGPMGAMVTKKTGEETEASLAKLAALVA